MPCSHPDGGIQAQVLEHGWEKGRKESLLPISKSSAWQHIWLPYKDRIVGYCPWAWFRSTIKKASTGFIELKKHFSFDRKPLSLELKQLNHPLVRE
ncbi:hypothetical protein SLEP1_g59768 [Rubroshorea leprosula]|uniref:Uncharacterized protein n=1 Tax=Rubroshorea leprosula TaxID=152421 RepID=A0AAV5MXE3_9ROSI|nr:hypothetical protein SLEP1_g59768 [Rubroshorea leprosula]